MYGKRSAASDLGLHCLQGLSVTDLRAITVCTFNGDPINFQGRWFFRTCFAPSEESTQKGNNLLRSCPSWEEMVSFQCRPYVKRDFECRKTDPKSKKLSFPA